MKKPRAKAPPWPSPLDFFSKLRWIDGRPLMDTIEPYRREVFLKALYSFEPNGRPLYNMVLYGTGKKNNKSTNLILAALFKLLIPETVQGNDGFILANDQDQAADDLSLAKKLVAANADQIGAEVELLSTEIKRRDGRGTLKILPAQNAVGQHGKTATFIGYDEIHGYRDYDLFEALAPDPTRPDSLIWITSYDTIYNSPGIPLYDYKKIGREGLDPRMLFVWYSGDFCTEPAFADLEPELRANPSMGSWPEGRAYLEQQRRRLPTHKYRRLHLNLPGALDGAFFDQGSVLSAIVPGRRSLPWKPETHFVGLSTCRGGPAMMRCYRSHIGRTAKRSSIWSSARTAAASHSIPEPMRFANSSAC
jgi:phage terminase large subunit-like protein